MARASLRGSNGGRSVRGDRAVWTGPEVDMFGRVSPDGTFITYVDWGGAGNLMLRDLATGTNRPLTAYDTAKPVLGVCGRLGRLARRQGGRVQLVQRRDNAASCAAFGLNGAAIPEPAVVYTTGDDVAYIWPMDWSSDGKWIATAVSRKDGTGQIALVGAGDGSFRVLKTVNWKGPARIFFSRDSRYIAYDLADIRDVLTARHLRDGHDDGREVPAIVHAASEDVVGWSPDGRQLLFSSDRTGSVGLWGQTITDGKPVGSAELLKADIGAVFSLGLTTEGALYGYKSVSSRDVRVAGIDLNAGKLQGDPRGFTQGFVARATVPDWSPDGRFLAYQACDDRACVAIRSVETGQVRTLQRGLLFTSSPRWSPDGRTLIAAARDRQGRNGIFRIDAQTGEFTNIVYGPGFPAQPQWSQGRREDLLRARRRDRTRPYDWCESTALAATGGSQPARPLAGRPVSRPRRFGVRQRVQSAPADPADGRWRAARVAPAGGSREVGGCPHGGMDTRQPRGDRDEEHSGS